MFSSLTYRHVSSSRASLLNWKSCPRFWRWQRHS